MLPRDSVSGSLLEERFCGLSRASEDHAKFNYRGKQRTEHLATHERERLPWLSMALPVPLACFLFHSKIIAFLPLNPLILELV